MELLYTSILKKLSFFRLFVVFLTTNIYHTTIFTDKCYNNPKLFYQFFKEKLCLDTVNGPPLSVKKQW